MLHGDPFDRILIAQAVHEGLTIVTADEQIPKYKVRTLW
jgi:PIN domain nuclease of toxin-antitoxin system